MRTMMLMIIMIMIIIYNYDGSRQLQASRIDSHKRAKKTVTSKTPPTGPTSLADFAWAQVRNSHRFPMKGPNLRLS